MLMSLDAQLLEIAVPLLLMLLSRLRTPTPPPSIIVVVTQSRNDATR